MSNGTHAGSSASGMKGSCKSSSTSKITGAYARDLGRQSQESEITEAVPRDLKLCCVAPPITHLRHAARVECLHCDAIFLPFWLFASGLSEGGA